MSTEALLNAQKQIEMLKQDLENANKKNELLEAEKMELQIENQTLQGKVEKITRSLHDMTAQVKIATTNTIQLQARRSEDITKKVEDFAKTVIFRNYKFFHPHKPQELQNAMFRCWTFLSARIDSLDLDKETFIFLYQGVVTHFISDACTYCQTQGKKAAYGKFIFPIQSISIPFFENSSF